MIRNKIQRLANDDGALVNGIRTICSKCSISLIVFPFYLSSYS